MNYYLITFYFCSLYRSQSGHTSSQSGGPQSFHFEVHHLLSFEFRTECHHLIGPLVIVLDPNFLDDCGEVVEGHPLLKVGQGHELLGMVVVFSCRFRKMIEFFRHSLNTYCIVMVAVLTNRLAHVITEAELKGLTKPVDV